MYKTSGFIVAIKTHERRAKSKPTMAFWIMSFASPIAAAFPAAVIYLIPPMISIITATIPTILSRKLYIPTRYIERYTVHSVGSPGILTRGVYSCAPAKLAQTNTANTKTITIMTVFFVFI